MFSSVDVAYASTWNKNSLLPPFQSLAPLLFSVKVSNSQVDGWSSSRSGLGRSTEHSHGLVLQLFYLCFWWLALTHRWGIGIHCPTPSSPFCASFVSSASITSHSLQHRHTIACQAQMGGSGSSDAHHGPFPHLSGTSGFVSALGSRSWAQETVGLCTHPEQAQIWPASPFPHLRPATD